VEVHNLESHHATPRCLLRLYDRIDSNGSADGGVEAWLEFELEAYRWSIPVEIARCDLEELVEPLRFC
jgi:hypothetical protein